MQPLSPTGKVFRILLIEDHSLSANIVEVILSKLRCSVDIADSGKSALKLEKRNQYDLIIMDIGLPDLDGFELTKKIRQHELKKQSRTPIVALTAHLDSESRQFCIDVGINAVFTKPLTQSMAENILTTYIHSDAHHILNTGPESIIDFNYSKNLFGGSEEAANKILQTFMQSLPIELANIKKAHKVNDWPEIHAHVHKLIGGASYCGTTRLINVCRKLDACLKTRRVVQRETLYRDLIVEIGLLIEYVTAAII